MARELEAVSQSSGIDRVELALGWVLCDKRVASIICDVRTVEQLQANLSVADQDIDDEAYAELTRRTDTDPDSGHLMQFAAHSLKSVFATHPIR